MTVANAASPRVVTIGHQPPVEPVGQRPAHGGSTPMGMKAAAATAPSTAGCATGT